MTEQTASFPIIRCIFISIQCSNNDSALQEKISKIIFTNKSFTNKFLLINLSLYRETLFLEVTYLQFKIGSTSALLGPRILMACDNFPLVKLKD